ncbi:MAG TPA: response regulator [Acidimicrobiales bacterium]|nr:response regulator [Acidimicrobiales bacterium]
MSASGNAVLVADDDLGIRSTVAEILRNEGYDVREAQDGDEALARLADGPVDVLLLDVRMPRRDGPAVLAALASPPVTILVSAFSLDGPLRQAVETKIFRYMRKPVRPRELISAVAEAAAKARSAS